MPPAPRPAAGGRRKPARPRPQAPRSAATGQSALPGQSTSTAGLGSAMQPDANFSTRNASPGTAPAPSASAAGFRAAVFAMIVRIPRGRVATYGQIARLAGYPRRARHVGMALANTPPGVQLPWHRVITAQGRIARRGGASRSAPGDGTQPGPAESRQMRLLQSEGVAFLRGRVDLLRFGWRPTRHALDTAPRKPRRRGHTED